MVALAIVCVTTFTACGGDDDDIPGTETGNLTVGTHRIDVSFEGNTSGWTTTVAFTGTAYPSGGGSKLYENGTELTTGVSGWTDNKFRNYSISTDDKAQNLLAVIYVRRNAHAAAEPVTVTLKSFVNDKQKKQNSVVVDGSHSTTTIFFYSEISDGDRVQELDY